jgi:hypothetical protein
MGQRTLDAEGVREAEARAGSVARALRFYESPAMDAGLLHIYGRRVAGEALRAAVEHDIPALAEAVRARDAEADLLRTRAERSPRDDRPGREAAAETAVDDLAGLLSAPFRVTPAMTSTAQSDPLMALAVQVARGAAQDAKEVDRARLIAMAFAAARGDMDGFWAARRQRSGAALKGEKPARRKK